MVEAFDLPPTFANEKLIEVPINAAGTFSFQKVVQFVSVESVYLDRSKGFGEVDLVIRQKRFDFVGRLLWHSHELVAREEQNLEI